MKILILGSAFSGLCQRVLRELLLLGHDIEQNYGMDEPLLRKQLAEFNPELILCPFLTHRIPDDVWQTYRCLVVHPGVLGDRGPSSLDWAISQQKSTWGVTLLQADAEMDAGDIWGTQNFALRTASKTSVYKREVSSAAVALIKQALLQIKDSHFQPRPLNYQESDVTGSLLPLMRQTDRAINWQQDTTSSILAKINAADTVPGVLDEIHGTPVHIFGAHADNQRRGEPGEILAIAQGAICRATQDGAVWIRQAKAKQVLGLPPIKLPAATVLEHLVPAIEFNHLQEQGKSHGFDDIWLQQHGDVIYIYFDFYNGAASTEQCLRLKEAVVEAKASSAKTLVLMGGENFFCNGIHLNVIEAASDPALESWRNINAIDDLILELINSPNHLTLAALRNNAGAGGAILALACDKVIGREGTVFNPHYNNMGLFGSEYWTYLLPKRVGAHRAQEITQACQPMLASEALEISFIDELFHEDWGQFHRELDDYAQALSKDAQRQVLLATKRLQRLQDEAHKPLAQYRSEELERMKRTFDDPQSYYHTARYNFVYKLTPANPCWRRAIAPALAPINQTA